MFNNLRLFGKRLAKKHSYAQAQFYFTNPAYFLTLSGPLSLIVFILSVLFYGGADSVWLFTIVPLLTVVHHVVLDIRNRKMGGERLWGFSPRLRFPNASTTVVEDDASIAAANRRPAGGVELGGTTNEITLRALNPASSSLLNIISTAFLALAWTAASDYSIVRIARYESDRTPPFTPFGKSWPVDTNQPLTKALEVRYSIMIALGFVEVTWLWLLFSLCVGQRWERLWRKNASGANDQEYHEMS